MDGWLIPLCSVGACFGICLVHKKCIRPENANPPKTPEDVFKSSNRKFWIMTGKPKLAW
jgi:hypothetical protein